MVVQLGKIEKETLIQAKGIKYNVGDLIKDKTLAKTFRNGFFITIYLAPKNYHRIHSPFSGTIEKTRYLEGNLYSVNFQSTRKIQSLYNNILSFNHTWRKQLPISLMVGKLKFFLSGCHIRCKSPF